MAKVRTVFFCQQCGHESSKWLGRCPGCGEWNSFVEEPRSKGTAGFNMGHVGEEPKVIGEIEWITEERYLTGSKELDQVLGGGIVPGSLTLLGGEPGIGKSTLLLQVANYLSKAYGRVLYISGEESAKQTKIRAMRLEIQPAELYVLAESAVEIIEEQIKKINPVLVIIDSIQTVFKSDLQSAPGSVGQVRESAAHFMRLAKTMDIPFILVGHVTKDGNIAGPRLLEHMVDTVLYFEGERHHTFRLLRGIKNRFGSTNELGLFEMGTKGLLDVPNASASFLTERPLDVPGTVVVAGMEGTRPLLLEIQALVSPSGYGTPRRTTTGLDYNRVALILAVLEKRVGLCLNNQDVFCNVAGGIRIDEPAIDLGVALAIASSFYERPLCSEWLVMGEIGLTGEIRSINQIERRLAEGEKLGFKKVIIPKANAGAFSEETFSRRMEIVMVTSVMEALEHTLKG